MSKFILELEFAGLALFVRRDGDGGMRVLLPDARTKPGVPRKHRDQRANENAEPHAAYVRFDMLNLPEFAEKSHRRVTDDSPSFEVVHRLDQETISFSLHHGKQLNAGKPVIQSGLDIPDFKDFASELRVKPKLASCASHDGIVGRLDLNGGEIESFNVSAEKWRLANIHNGKNPPVADKEYGGMIVWSSLPLDGDRITMTLTRFDGSGETKIALVPHRTDGAIPRIRIKIANLCSNNPLEWDELPPRLVAQEDVDFKWLYQLLEHRSESPKTWERRLPVPVPVAALAEGELYDCFSGKIDDGEGDGDGEG